MTKDELLAKRQSYVLHAEKWEQSTAYNAALTVAFSRDMIKTIDKQLAQLEG